MAAKKKTKKKASAKKASAKSTRKASAKKPASSGKKASSSAKKKATSGKKKAAKKKKVSAKRTKKSASAKSQPKAKKEAKVSAAAAEAKKVLEGEGAKTIAELGEDLASGKKSVAAAAARVLDEVVEAKAEAVVPIIDKYAAVIGRPARRPAQSAAKALPLMSRIAPARVARHLPKLKGSFSDANAPGRDGLVRTFAGLCTASVAYQKRLEDVLNQALSEADAKTLIAWTEVVLPALKGEPHARARATVEGRLGRIPKVHAQKIADFLGIKLRLRYR